MNFKKYKLIFINSVLILIIACASFNIYKSKSNSLNYSDFQNVSKEYDTNNTTTELINPETDNTNTTEKEILVDYSKYIDTEGNIDDKIISYLESRLHYIPNTITNNYFDNGGRILITDKNISKTYYKEYNFGNIIGLHDARKNIIYMSNSQYAIDNALIHEFGHVLDYICEWDSMNESFSQIFKKEKDTFQVQSVDGHYKTNEREFFAEVFQEYILHPDTCKSSAPNAFDFVHNKINSLEQKSISN